MTKVISLAPVQTISPLGRLHRIFASSASDCLSRPSVLYADGKMNKRAPERWNARIPVEPEVAFEILTRDLPGLTRVEMLLETRNSFYIDMRSPDFTHNRSFNLKTRTTDTGSIEVEETSQNNGLGRIWARNQIELAKALGMMRFSLLAGAAAGGYFWARMGFVPNDIGSDGFDQLLRQPVTRKFVALAPLLNQDEKNLLAPHLAVKHAEDLYRLATAPVDITSRLQQVFQAHAREEAGHLKQALGHEFTRRVGTGKRTGIGQALLSGTNWYGHLDLQNAKQMQRVGEYVGGWKYIALK